MVIYIKKRHEAIISMVFENLKGKIKKLVLTDVFCYSVCGIIINLLKDVVTHSSIIWHFAGLIEFDSSSIEHRC